MWKSLGKGKTHAHNFAHTDNAQCRQTVYAVQLQVKGMGRS